MQKNSLKESSILPPNVRGKSRGFIEIEILNIRWKTKFIAKRFENYDIVAKIFWWGQDKLSARNLNLKSKVIQYTILTNCKLFYNYLINCEPVTIILYTRTSNYQIGVVKAKVPTKITKSCKTFLLNEILACTETQKYIIQSEKGVELGEIFLKFTIMFHDPISVRESAFDTTFLKAEKSKLDKEVELICSSRCYKDTKGKRNLNKVDEIHSSRIVNYLSGRRMSKKEEEQALKEIQRTSPLNEKFLENLCINIPKSPQNRKVSTPYDEDVAFCHNTQPFRDKFDSLYLNVKYIKLLPPGVREVYVKSLVKTTFTIECKISPNLLDTDLKRRLNYDVMRFYSNTFDDKEQRIDFNKEAVRPIKLACEEINEFLVDHSEILFTVWWREYGSRYSRCLGTTKFRFTNLLSRSHREEDATLKVKSCTAGVHVADLHCRLVLRSKSNCFCSESNGINDQFKRCRYSMASQENRCPTCIFPDVRDYKVTKTPNNENHSANSLKQNNSLDRAKQTASATYQTSVNLSTINRPQFDDENQDRSSVQTSEKHQLEKYIFLKGLLYVGRMTCVNNIEDADYFCVARAFWKDDPSSSGFSHDNNFNFLEVFSIINDTKFLERVRNNVLVVELWQKSKESHEKLFGIIRLPLHQFYIAFRDPLLADHLCKAKLPVISIDGLTPIFSPLSGIICGHIQCLLCVGTEEQLNNLKQSRGFNLNPVYESSMLSTCISAIAVPNSGNIQEQKLKQSSKHAFNDVAIQTNGVNDIKENYANCSSTVDNKNNKEKLSNILGNFLDNLSQKLPPPSSPNVSSCITSSTIQQQPVDNQSSLRRTSDLLDMLQKALIQPQNGTSSQKGDALETIAASTTIPNTFKILLEIECALHLPRNPIKMMSKKSNKRCKGKQSRFPPNEEPSAYVTFQAEEGYGQMFKSHEGLVYATNVIEKCSNPSWGKRFEICLSTEYLRKDNKPFMIRVWKKAATDLAHCRLLPTPMEDSIIGVSSIDLTVLMARMPLISGWYNIIDFSGKVNGQIKLTIKPLEDVLKFKNFPTEKKVNTQSTGSISLLNTKNSINNINFDCADLDLGLAMDMTLSRAFKRKLVELEEINQRLRARLLDVTGEADPDIDLSEIDDEQMDEFERDLNTECKEDEEENKLPTKQNDNFAWLQDNNIYNDDNNIESHNIELTKNLNRIDNSDDSNCSNQEKIKIISDFLEKTEISNKNEDSSDK
ncbi:uncharacterized protein LOC129610168 [Condylostylus longicornis]|uniref:uncharacterized protein LOC129610168 n=1 Tax=Condylostylus longicornis TaxID=2530218 RepID=UPI00244E220C|nr:uncharacterized protein LOC129610168 [Condylostylus longicornis]